MVKSNKQTRLTLCHREIRAWVPLFGVLLFEIMRLPERKVISTSPESLKVHAEARELIVS